MMHKTTLTLFLLGLMLASQSCSSHKTSIHQAELLARLGFDTNRSGILILFRISDCPLCLFEAEYWSQAANHGLQVALLTNDTQQTKIASFAEDYQFQGPIIQDAAIFNEQLLLLKDQGYDDQTPAKLFFDHAGNLLKLEYGTKDIQRQQQFLERAIGIFESLP